MNIYKRRIQEICIKRNLDFSKILSIVEFIRKTYNVDYRKMKTILENKDAKNIPNIYDYLKLKENLINISFLPPKVNGLERYMIYYDIKGHKIYKEYCKNKTKKWKPISHDSVSLKFHINKYGEEEGPKKYKERVGAINTVSIDYWLKQGFSEEDAKKMQSERQSTFSLEKCLKKYGEKEGIRIFNERQDKWQNTLNKKPQDEIDDINRRKGITLKNMINKYGEEEGRLKYDDWYNRRKMSKNFSNKQFIGNEKDALLYYIHFFNTEISFWKIGVTTKSVESRFGLKKIKSKHGLEHEIIFVSIDTAHNVFIKEQFILEEFLNKRITVDYNGFFSTECFNENVLEKFCK